MRWSPHCHSFLCGGLLVHSSAQGSLLAGWGTDHMGCWGLLSGSVMCEVYEHTMGVLLLLGPWVFILIWQVKSRPHG